MKHKALQEPKPFRAFRDKYLAALMMAAALLISFVATAQLDSAKYSPINGYGFKYKRMAFDSILMVPRSTSPHIPYRSGAIRYHAADSTLQLWTGYQWKSIVTGGSGIDTAYVVGDSLIVIETPNEDYYINVRGQNISNSSLTANGDYVQDWMHHWFFLNDLKAVDFNSYRADDNHPGNKKRFRFYSDSTIDNNALQLMWGLKNINEDNTDSLHFELTSTKNLTYLYHYTDGGSKMIEMDWDPAAFYPSTKIYANGNGKNGYYELGTSTAEINPHDSIALKAVAKASADSVFAPGPLINGINTLYKVPMPTGGSATLNNVGTGFPWATTPNGSIKRFNPTYGLTADSSTSNTISLRADTSSTNHLITQSDLNDAIAGAGSGITGLTTGRVVIPGSATTITDDAGLLYNTTQNKVTTDSIRSIKNTPDTVHIGWHEGDITDTAYFFGTSITAGSSATPASVARYSKIVADGLRVVENNNGLGGYLLQKSPAWPLTNTFKDVYTSYIPAKLPGRKYLFFAWGENDATNDQSYHTLFQVDTSYFKRDYVVVINYALSQGWSLADMRIISPFYQLETSASYTLQQSYRNAAKQIADSLGVQFIDILPIGKSYGDQIRTDYIHPSNYGHALYGNAILRALTQPLQIKSGENLVNAATTVLNKVYHFGKDTATTGYQLAGFNTDNTLVKVPAEVFWKVDNTNVPVQSGNGSILGNITAGKAIRASGQPTYTSGAGFEIYYDNGNGFMAPFNRGTPAFGNIFMPFSKLIVGNSTPSNPYTQLYVSGAVQGSGLFSSGSGNVLYNTSANQTTLNMLVSGDSVGHVTTYSAAGYKRLALNGTSSEPVVIGALRDNGSSAKLQVTGRLSVSIHTLGSNSDSAVTWNRTTGAYEYSKINTGSSGTLQDVITAGATLSSTNTIVAGNNAQTLTGTQSAGDAWTFSNNGNGGALAASANGSGISFKSNNSSSGIAIFGSASSGTGGYFTSTTGLPLYGAANPSSTNTSVVTLMTARSTSSTAAAGLGDTWTKQLEDDAGNLVDAANFTSAWTSAATGAASADVQIATRTTGSMTTKVTLLPTSQVQFNGYGAGTHTVTPATTPIYSSGGLIGERIAPKIYTALLTQSGTSDPTATVLGTNEIGTIVWTRNSTGSYTGTLTGAFTANKTWAIVQKGAMDGGGFVNGQLTRGGNNTVALDVRDNAANVTDGFTNMSIEIRVYP